MIRYELYIAGMSSRQTSRSARTGNSIISMTTQSICQNVRVLDGLKIGFNFLLSINPSFLPCFIHSYFLFFLALYWLLVCCFYSFILIYYHFLSLTFIFLFINLFSSLIEPLSFGVLPIFNSVNPLNVLFLWMQKWNIFKGLTTCLKRAKRKPKLEVYQQALTAFLGIKFSKLKNRTDDEWILV